MTKAMRGRGQLRALATLVMTVSAFVATTDAATAATTQSGTQLAAGTAITFQGAIEGPSAPNLIGPGLGCASGSEPNCAFVSFRAQASAAATLTLKSTTTDVFGSYESLDFEVGCNGAVRATGSTDPGTGNAATQVPVNAGEQCTLRITSFLGSLRDLGFSGRLALPAAGTVDCAGSGSGSRA